MKERGYSVSASGGPLTLFLVHPWLLISESGEAGFVVSLTVSDGTL